MNPSRQRPRYLRRLPRRRWDRRMEPEWAVRFSSRLTSVEPVRPSRLPAFGWCNFRTLRVSGYFGAPFRTLRVAAGFVRMALPVFLLVFLGAFPGRATDVVMVPKEPVPVTVTVPVRPVRYYVQAGPQPISHVVAGSRVTLRVTEGLPTGTQVVWLNRGAVIPDAAGVDYDLGIVGVGDSGYYQAILTLPGGAGFPLAIQLEVIDPQAISRCLNASLRGHITRENPQLIGGITVGANRGDPILIRAVGPTLEDFGIAQPLDDPQLRLFDAAGNSADRYILAGTIPEMDPASPARRAGERVGAFPLPAGRADIAVLAALPPGVYTAHVSSRSGGSGEVLLEFFDVPGPGPGDYPAMTGTNQLP